MPSTKSKRTAKRNLQNVFPSSVAAGPAHARATSAAASILNVKAYSNCDHTYVVWRCQERIENCLGFALIRRRANGAEETVNTWVGFAQSSNSKPGSQMPSTTWPIQKYMWSDLMAEPGEALRYKVVPMKGTVDRLVRDDENASDWSEPVTVATTPGAIHAYFNRGIVATQWLSRKLGDIKGGSNKQKLKTVIETEGDATRNFLAGAAREAVIELLSEAADNRLHVYAILYELNDPELIDALKKLGKKAHVILANGTHKSAGDDENADARAELQHVIDLHDRMVTGYHLAHNKYMVLCDVHGNAAKVLTGSLNWTVTGLCTQANNTLVIENSEIAAAYKEQWQHYLDAGDDYPAELYTEHADAATATVKEGRITCFFNPLKGEADLDYVRERMKRAKQGVLFLFFNPGPSGTLFNDILDLRKSRPDLYLHGVINQDETQDKASIIFVHRGAKEEADPAVVIPQAIDERLKFWQQEMKQYSMVMVHSKVIVIDPFGDDPMVVTGSNNLGPKASGKNDDNMAIIEGDASLAAQYAVNIMGIYNQYRWRWSRMNNTSGKSWGGLSNKDTWQDTYLNDKDRLRELDFWMGVR